jgi:hypothetical protein
MVYNNCKIGLTLSSPSKYTYSVIEKINELINKGSMGVYHVHYSRDGKKII